MLEFIRKLHAASFKVRLFLILGFYLLAYLLGMAICPDEYSPQGEMVFSVIHLFFLTIIIKFFFDGEKFTKTSRIVGWTLLVLTIAMNVIPYEHGLTLHDNGFVPMWSMVPQTEFGWPVTFLRIFSSNISNIDVNTDYVVHFNAFAFNLCVISALIALELKLISSWKKRISD